MKKILIIFLTIFLVIGMLGANGQENTEVPEEDTEEGGVAPGSVFYGLDKALERINLALTFNKAEKAKKGLEHARERILESKKLVRENKLEKLEKLKEDHKKSLEEVKANLDELSKENPEEAIEKQIEIENGINKQENELEETTAKIDLKLSANLNEEQLAKLKDFLNSLGKEVTDLKIKSSTNKEKTKIRLKDELKKSDIEVEQKIKALREKHKSEENKQEFAEKAVKRLENKYDKLKEITQKHKEKGKDVTVMEERLKEVEATISEIKTKLQNKEFDGARDLVKKAEQLLNFREVFRALETENNEKLKELHKSRLEKLDEIKKEIKELREIKKEIKEEKRESKQEKTEQKSDEAKETSENKGRKE